MDTLGIGRGKFFFLLLSFIVFPCFGNSDSVPPVTSVEIQDTTRQIIYRIESTQVTNAEELDAAVQWATKAVTDTDAQGGHSIVIADSGDPLAQKVAEAAPNTEVLSKPAPESRLRRIVNMGWTIFRFAGVTYGVTTVISIQSDLPAGSIGPLAAGALAGTMSGSLQVLNKNFQNFLAGPHYVRFPKLWGVTATYLGGLNLVAHITGMDHSEILSLNNLAGIGISATFGTLMEYMWDTYNTLSLARNTSRDPRNASRYLMISDAQAALISVFGTTFQVMAERGNWLGHVLTVGLMTGGLGMYFAKISSPRETLALLRESIKAAAKGAVSKTVSGCQYLLSAILPQ